MTKIEVESLTVADLMVCADTLMTSMRIGDWNGPIGGKFDAPSRMGAAQKLLQILQSIKVTVSSSDVLLNVTNKGN